jgi:drug/metabolite transporter (DMT)-like permease
MPSRGLKQMLLEAGLVLGWSSGFIGAIIAAETQSVLQVILWRFIIVSLVLLPWTIPTLLRKPPLAWLLTQFLLGLFGVFLALTTGIFAIDLGVPAANSALIGALMPLVTAALVGPFLGEQVSLRQWAGLICGILGVAVAIGGGEITGSLLGYVLSFVSMASTVVATILAKKHWKQADLVPGFGVQAMATAALTLPLALWDGHTSFSIDPTFLVSIAWFVVFSTLCAYGFYYLCLMRTSAVRVGSLLNLTPAVTAIWAWAMFGQPITLAVLAGLAISWFGIQLTRPRNRPEAEAAAVGPKTAACSQ